LEGGEIGKADACGVACHSDSSELSLCTIIGVLSASQFDDTITQILLANLDIAFWVDGHVVANIIASILPVSDSNLPFTAEFDASFMSQIVQYLAKVEIQTTC